MADVRVPVSTLKWIGDSLFCGGDPALFQFMRSDGAIEIMLLEECLTIVHRIDTYGRGRIVSALEYGLQHNMLADADRDAWQAERARVVSWTD